MKYISKNIELMKSQTAAHIESDAVIQGTYWEESENDVGGSGCFIGCLTHSSHASDVTEGFGLPLSLVRICEGIFENLEQEESVKFFGDIPYAVECDGKDLSKIHWLFLKETLEVLPDVPDDIQKVIDPVIEGMGKLARGEEWKKEEADAADAAAYTAADAARAAAYTAARAAAYTARAAAYTAADAARAAADAAAYTAAYTARVAADAAYAVEVRRQRDSILRLLKEAPMLTS